jgi:predicted DNA-binding transcriptional regulator YafY
MNPRSQSSRPPLERMLRIHEELRRGALVNCTMLMHALEVSRKTVVRDIAFMRDRLELPIEFDSGIQAYRYTEKVSAFPTVNVTEGELLALLVAQRALEQYRGDAVSPSAGGGVCEVVGRVAGQDFVFAGGRAARGFV